MIRRLFVYSLAILMLLTTVSCKQVFTTSIAKPLARDSLKIPDNAPTKDILNIAKSQGLSDASAAKAVLAALGSKDKKEITDLSATDRATILNLATSATISMKSLTELASSATADGADVNNVIEDFFVNFSSDTDLRAVEIILGDTENMSALPADSLVTASAVLIADLAKDIPAEDLMGLLSGGEGTTTLTEAQQDRINLVRGVQTNIDGRSEDELSSINVGGFNLADLIKGTNQGI